MSTYDLSRMRRLSADIRIKTILALTAAGYGHIGGAMSICDVLGVLYGGVMNIRPEDPGWEARDYFVLSKGHCGAALYAALALLGYFSLEALDTINQAGTMLPSHCDCLKTPGVDMSTGSLGQGVSCAVGIALANKLKNLGSYTYAIIGDGESQEGQVWEAIDMAVQAELGHFILFIDDNKKQLDGDVKEHRDKKQVLSMLQAAGMYAVRIPGYDAEHILHAINQAKQQEKPSAIILDTYKSLGYLPGESKYFNHYMTMDAETSRQAIEEIEKRLAEGTYPRGRVTW